jgi:hypothetical protein
MFCAKEPERFEAVRERISAITKIFDMEHLHPSLCVNVPLTAAGG